MSRRIVLLVVVLAAPIIIWQVSMLAGHYYYGSLAQSPSSSVPARSSVPGTYPQPTERSNTASVMPTEETTTFQVPEGTRTSSTARIVCLRQEEGAPPPTKSTEALNGDVLTRVLTPKVAAHPDGVHFQIDNRLGTATTYSYYDNGEYLGGDPIPKGISNHVLLSFPPGPAEIQCDPTGDFNAYETARARFEIVVGDSGYKPLELECAPSAEPRFSGTVASGASSKFELVSYRDPVEETRRYYSKELKEGDVVEEAGYPQDPNPTVRVVRDGKVIATYWSSTMNMHATYCF